MISAETYSQSLDLERCVPSVMRRYSPTLTARGDKLNVVSITTNGLSVIRATILTTVAERRMVMRVLCARRWKHERDRHQDDRPMRQVRNPLLRQVHRPGVWFV